MSERLWMTYTSLQALWGENDVEDIDIKSDIADVSDTDDEEKIDDDDDIISECNKIKSLTWARELSCRAPLADW